MSNLNQCVAVFRPTISVTFVGDGSVAQIVFDWSDSFDEIYDPVNPTSDYTKVFVTVMDAWTKKFPTVFRTAGIVLSDTVIAEIMKDKPISAIKQLRAETNLPLQAAKQLVMSYRERNTQ